MLLCVQSSVDDEMTHNDEALARVALDKGQC